MKRAKMNVVFLVVLLFMRTLAFSSQTTETFESFSIGATSFTSNGVVFNMTPGGFSVDVLDGYGYASSNNFIDNFVVIPNPCQIRCVSIFTVKSLYLYPSALADGNMNQTSGVNVTFTGKYSGSTRFTYSPPSSDFAAASYMDPGNRGFSLVNFATPGYDNTIIDELVVTLGGTTVYFAIDNFTWATATVPVVTFTNGSGFTPEIEEGEVNQALGRFRLTGDVSGSSLTAASVKLNGTRTGLSNLKLWISTDAAFDSGVDTQLGSTVGSDPGNGNSVSFSGFTGNISTSGTYFFLTGDVALGATGKVQGVIVQGSSLSFFLGTLSGSISNAPLSSIDASLPVGLASFSAFQQGGSILLKWVTESEVNNAGFILERSAANGGWIQIASYRTNDELKGQGNKSSRTEYAFIDPNVETGKEYRYRLSDVSTQGKITAHEPLSAKSAASPEKTEMKNAYPNPFNSQMNIAYQLAEETSVAISVFDILGRSVKMLYNGRQFAGNYQAYWDGTDETGSQVPGGFYFIQMKTKNLNQIKKIILLK